MGRKDEQARQAVKEFEIRLHTSGELDEIEACVDRAISSVSTNWRFSLERFEARHRNGAMGVPCQLRGPGGVVTIMKLSVLAEPASTGGFNVEVVVTDFLYQKGGVLQGPSINGAKVIRAFVDALRAEIESLPASPGSTPSVDSPEDGLAVPGEVSEGARELYSSLRESGPASVEDLTSRTGKDAAAIVEYLTELTNVGAASRQRGGVYSAL